MQIKSIAEYLLRALFLYIFEWPFKTVLLSHSLINLTLRTAITYSNMGIHTKQEESSLGT